MDIRVVGDDTTPVKDGLQKDVSVWFHFYNKILDLN